MGGGVRRMAGQISASFTNNDDNIILDTAHILMCMFTC